MAANKYIVDFNKLVTWLVPPRLRGLILLGWLKAMVTPIAVLYNDFIRYRDSVNYRTAITPQVFSLEKVLNDTFDLDQRRIAVLDTASNIVTLIHTDAADIALLTYQDNDGYDDQVPVIHDDSAYAESGFDFTVSVPFSVSEQDIYRMKSILNTYKLASKKYKIFSV